MLIDPFTVFVQILNFVILVFLLKRFLFKPITRAIAAREEKIATALQEAKTTNEHARQKLQEMEARAAEVAAGEAELLRQARSRAATLEEKLMHEAKTAARAKQEHLREALDREKIQRLDDLHRELADHVYKATDQALRDLSGRSLQSLMVACFFDRLEHETDGEQKEFTATFRSGSSLTVATPEPLDTSSREHLQTLLAEKFGFKGSLHFEVEEDVLAGMVISGNGRKIAWTIEKYLKDFKNGLLNQELPA